jgi:hypothetical protein
MTCGFREECLRKNIRSYSGQGFKDLMTTAMRGIGAVTASSKRAVGWSPAIIETLSNACEEDGRFRQKNSPHDLVSQGRTLNMRRMNCYELAASFKLLLRNGRHKRRKAPEQRVNVPGQDQFAGSEPAGQA